MSTGPVSNTGSLPDAAENEGPDSTPAPAVESRAQVRYLVFDTEAVADGDLVRKIRFPNEEMSALEAIQRYRAQIKDERSDGKDILPVTFMLPISVALAKVDPQYRLLDVVVLDAPQYRPHKITEQFWKGYKHYRPTLVSFNGRGYDVPLMELAAFRYGLSLPFWFNMEDKSYEQSRYRYNCHAHEDLCDLINNYGAMRLNGGLNLMANLIGKPGKTGVDGSQVQDMYYAGKLTEINDYCRCDVLDTYFVFLRTRVLLGKLTLPEEHQRVLEARKFLEARVDQCAAYAHYLEHWGEWIPPSP